MSDDDGTGDEVVFAPHGRGIWLRFRGSDQIKAFVRDNFPLAVPA